MSVQKHKYDEALRQLAKNNDLIQTFVAQTSELEPLRKRRKRLKPDFRSFHEQVKSIYSGLKPRWSCNCTSPHFANLCVGPPGVLSNGKNEGLSAEEGNDQEKFLYFKAVFTRDQGKGPHEWTYQETQLKLYQKTDVSSRATSNGTVNNKAENCGKPEDKLGKVRKRDRMKVMFKTPSDSAETSEGLAASKPSVLFGKDVAHSSEVSLEGVELPVGEESDIDDLCRRFLDLDTSPPPPFLAHFSCGGHWTLVIYPATMHKNVSPGLSSLTRVLSKPTEDSRHRRLGRGDRFLLAYMIASSVVRFSKTPWLSDYWKKDDFKIIDDETRELKDRIYLSKPFPEKRSDEESRSEFPLLRNQTLFALGVVLIELCLGQTFEAMRDPSDPLDRDGKANALTDWSTATRLLPDVFQEAGNRYSDAVRRCIYCDFDQRITSLENEGFKQAVYDGVVAPLEEVLRDFQSD